MTRISKSKPIVIKVGSSLLTDKNFHLSQSKMKNLVEQVAEIKKDGYQCILVTSGAIAAGLTKLGLKKRPLEIPKLQAAAAVGQCLLMQQYTDLFAQAGITVGQVLITQFDMNHRELYLNARNTFKQLLDYGVIPIVNENDTTAVQEIKFGDNDSLAALVAVLTQAQLLIILSDVPGLFNADPRQNSKATLIKEVEEITPEIESMASGIGSDFSVGGMQTKIAAAKIVTAAQIGMVITQGDQEGCLALPSASRSSLKGILRAMTSEAAKKDFVGTYFLPKKQKITSKKLWIGFGTIPKGQVLVDAGAAKALTSKGKSLLPAGVVGVKGDFDVGDAVDIIAAETGSVFARGLTNYSSRELEKIKGKKSHQVSKIIKEPDFYEEVIHRDNLVVL